MSNVTLAEDQTVTDDAGYTYTIYSDGEATLKTAPASLTGSVTIPATVADQDGKEHTVTSIGEEAFKDCGEITAVTIPSGITSIANDAFSGCTSFASFDVEMGNTAYLATEDGLLLSAVSPMLVMCPTGKSDTLNVSRGITEIGDAAFMGCSKLTSIILGAEVKKIGGSAFAGCEGLRSLSFYFGDDCTANDAFCGSETSNASVTVNLVRLPEKDKLKGLNSLLGENFSNIDYVMSFVSDFHLNTPVFPYQSVHLPSPTLDGRALTYTLSINGGDFKAIADTVYTFMPSVSTAQSFAIKAEAAKPEGYDAYEGITISFPYKMFESSMDVVDFAYSFDDEKGTATLTGVRASLTEAVLPDSVWAGGKDYVLAGLAPGAFKDLSALTSVTLPDGVEVITDEAFSGCANLTHIGVNTSNRAAKVADVTWPSRLKSIGAGAFNGCSGMAGSLELPATLESIGEGAFKACSSLTELSLNLNSATTIAESAFEGCSELTKVTVNAPEGIEGIGAGAFKDCSALTEVSLNVNSSASIDASAFAGCSELSKVTVNAPEGIEASHLEAVATAFKDCAKLTTVAVTAPTGTDTSKLSEVLGTNVKVEVSTSALRIVGQGSVSKARSGAYDLSGRRVVENHRGLVVEQGKLRLRK